jgi:hypothetical protein
MPTDLLNRKQHKPNETSCILCGLGLLLFFIIFIYSMAFIAEGTKHASTVHNAHAQHQRH